MKTAEDLLIEINLAARITRDPRLLALLGDIKAFLESSPPAPSRTSPLDPQEGRLPRASTAMPSREAQIRKANYMREWMRRKRQKDRDAKNAIINSTSPDYNRDRNQDRGQPKATQPTAGDAAIPSQSDKAPWEDK